MIDVCAGLSQKPFEPKMHLFYECRILDIKDGLPKFKNVPKDFGGSDETMDE